MLLENVLKNDCHGAASKASAIINIIGRDKLEAIYKKCKSPVTSMFVDVKILLHEESHADNDEKSI